MFTTEFTQDQPCFTVALCDYPGLPDTERQRAEARYARTLARQLGGEPEVRQRLAHHRATRRRAAGRDHRRSQIHLPALDEGRHAPPQKRACKAWAGKKAATLRCAATECATEEFCKNSS